MPLNRKRLLPLAILAIALAGFAVLRATRPQQPPVEARERVWQVEVMAVQPARLAPTLTLYGQVETPALLKAAAPSGSRVETVRVREGDRVASEQLLLTLDPRDFEPRLAQERAQVAELEAELESEHLRHAADRRSLAHENRLLALSESAVSRAERLKKDKLGSDAALDEAREARQRQALAVTTRRLAIDAHDSRVRQLEARLRRARAQLAQAELDWERSRVTAPFAGYIGKVHVAAGDQVQSAATLLTLYASETLEIRAKIPAPFQDELQSALRAGAQLTARARIGGTPLQLRLDRLSGEADPRGVDALFSVESGAELLRPGIVLALQLERQPQPDAVPIPYRALYGADRIYKLVAGRMQSIKIVALGDYVDADGKARLLISSPELKDGDRIVITHLPNAVHGLRVAPVSDSEMAAQPESVSSDG